MSDTYAGLKKAIKTVFQGASWQSCRVHFMRNVLTVVPTGSQNMVASTIRTIFTQPAREHSNKRLTEVVPTLGRSHFQVAIMLDEARHDFLAFDLSRVSLNGTGGKSGPGTRRNASTRKLNAAPTSSPSSPTEPPCCAWPALS